LVSAKLPVHWEAGVKGTFDEVRGGALLFTTYETRGAPLYRRCFDNEGLFFPITKRKEGFSNKERFVNYNTKHSFNNFINSTSPFYEAEAPYIKN
jgi:hypothetical protein